MAKKKAVHAAPIPTAPSLGRDPVPTDNPRHAVWIEDERGIRRITATNPGEQRMLVGGRTYIHTREVGNGQWVYTLEAP